MICRFVFLAFAIFFSFTASAEVINKIVIQGNERVEDETIKSYIDITLGANFTRDNLNDSIKKLYSSNLFQKVDLTEQGSTLYVKVIENPKINLVVFEGNSKIKSKDLEAEISLKPRSIYTKAKVQEDVNRIIDLYNKNGRFSAKVIPQIIVLPQNRVDLIYKIEEGPMAKIGKIVFVGNNEFSDSRLESELSSKETHWYYFLSTSDQFNPVRLEYDRELLTRFYNSRGYADFKIISIITNVSEKKERFYITITLDEGSKYDFGQINLVSDLKANNINLDDLKADITTKENDVYDIRKVEKSIDLMIQQINDKGYAFVDIDPEMHLDQEKKLVNITYHIGESRKVYINRINIKGNVRTADKVIRREFRLSEGDPYNATKLNRSEQKINDLDFFERANIDTLATEDPDKVNLNLELQEKSTSSINLAAGYSTTDGPIGKIGFSEPNLMGSGQQLDLSLSKSQYRFDSTLSYTQPYMFDMPISGGFDIFTQSMSHDSSQYRSYDQSAYGFVLRSGYDVTEYLAHNVYYGLTKSDISHVASNANSAIQNQAGHHTSSMVGHNLVYDKRDSAINTTEGYIVTVSQDFAGLGGDTKFLRHTAKGRYYHPIITDDIVLVLGAEGGRIDGLDNKDVNISDRFFLGGESLRGFNYYGVGPRAQSDNEALGGNIYYTSTAEVKFPLGFGKELGLFGSVFADAGSLYHVDNPTNAQIWDSKKIRSSLGAGIGFTTPMGPVRIYYAVPVIKTNFDREKNFDISFKTTF